MSNGQAPKSGCVPSSVDRLSEPIPDRDGGVCVFAFDVCEGQPLRRVAACGGRLLYKACGAGAAKYVALNCLRVVHFDQR